MAEAVEERDAPPGFESRSVGSLKGPRSEEGRARKEIAMLLVRAQRLADDLAARPNLGLTAAPRRELERMQELGLLSATFPVALGGLGLGVTPGTQDALLRLLSIVGGADLALGRLFEGHVNGILLVLTYGTPEQAATLADEVGGGMLSGVWNTGRQEVLRLEELQQDEAGGAYRFEGQKTFATGAAFVQRPVVTADLPGRGWQMTVPAMETLGASIDRSFWHPLGMESSESFGVDFTGGIVPAERLLGAPGDFYRDPLFRGGAVRFAAVQAGAVLRLHALFAHWLTEKRRGEDPYQIARLGEVAMLAQEAVLWVEKAAATCETSLFRMERDHVERMIECANMTRTAIERLATRTMQLVTAGVGAHGLLHPHRFERILRDLTMYLRQPEPDQTVAAIGRASLDKLHKRQGGASGGFWSEDRVLHSLPPAYFQRIYDRQEDPWDFVRSDYEQAKYERTLASLPRRRYGRGLEVGCSIGVLSQRLGARCEQLLCLDVSSRALERARERNEGDSHIHFACMQVPQELPEGCFDLIVVSEVAYYWRQFDLEAAADGLAERQAVGGHLMLVHLTEFVPDYPLTGDAVHEYWLARPEWKHVHCERHERYRLDVLERVG